LERKRAREEGFIRITEARYNERYKEVLAEEEVPRYLMRGSLERMVKGDRVRALARLRCGYLEDWNKFWLEEDRRKCRFCGNGRDRPLAYGALCGGMCNNQRVV